MERRLAAILAADVVGYSRLMSDDEAGTLAALKRHRADVFDPLVARHNGRIVKLMGDGVLVEFASVVDAVECAVAVQAACASTADTRINLRIGVNVGDVIVDGDDLYGDGVNVAARIEAQAPSGGIAVSEYAHDQVARKTDIVFEDTGEHELKNIAGPVRIFHVIAKPDAATATAESAPAPVSEKPSIAVLAFTNMSGDPEQEYFSDGISEDIITELSRYQDLFVIARNSSFSYKGKATKVQDIGSDLGVAYIVEGSVRKAGRRIRVTVQLIETATGNHIWAEKYDRDLVDIFELQDEITRTIVTVLPIRLRSAMIESSSKKPSTNLSAYDYFLKARWLYYQTSGKSRDDVLDLLAQAVETDPKCTDAYALTATVHAYSVFTFSPIGDDPTIAAVENIERALASGEGEHYVHTQAAHVYMICGKHELAKLHSDRALVLNPNDIFAATNQGMITTYLGDPLQGVDQLNEALAHDPLSPDLFFEDLAEAYYMLHDYENAIEIFQRWKNPPVHTYTHLAACYAQLGRMEEARHAVEMFNEARPENSDFAFYATAHARLCKRSEDADHWIEGYRKAGLID